MSFFNSLLSSFVGSSLLLGFIQFIDIGVSDFLDGLLSDAMFFFGLCNFFGDSFLGSLSLLFEPLDFVSGCFAVCLSCSCHRLHMLSGERCLQDSFDYICIMFVMSP